MPGKVQAGTCGDSWNSSDSLTDVDEGMLGGLTGDILPSYNGANQEESDLMVAQFENQEVSRTRPMSS
jgi:hypothetical protein